MKKNLLWSITLVFLVIFSASAFWFYSLYTPVVSDKKGKVYYLRPGAKWSNIAIQLQEEGLLSFPKLFLLYAHLHGLPPLKSGEYLFPAGSTPVTIWRQVTSGTGLAYRRFAIIPGWTFNQLRNALSHAEGLKHATQPMTNQQIMGVLDHTSLSPEGMFYPETYYYTRDEADWVILKRAFNLMQSRLQDIWQKRLDNLPFNSPYQILIAASLVEKEAYLNTERPVIAGVIINRLRKNMLLQIDPTVIFGMGEEYAGKIHKADLLRDTPYNTYVHRGLPPTPIAFPSLASLEAAARPDINPYYYFVAKGDGSHQFSASLPQHNAAVATVIKTDLMLNNIDIIEHLRDVLELENGFGQIH